MFTGKMEDRIKKLLKIAEQSTFPHEAEAALLKAQELMAIHRISVSISGDAVEEEIETHEILLEARLEEWKKLLGTVIAENFRCYPFFRRWKSRHLSALCFLGRHQDVALASAVFHAAALGAMSCYGKWQNKDSSTRREFLMGFCYGLKEQFELQKQKEENQEWALALVVDNGVKKVFEDLDMKKADRRRPLDCCSTAFSSGYARGLRHNVVRGEALEGVVSGT